MFASLPEVLAAHLCRPLKSCGPSRQPPRRVLHFRHQRRSGSHLITAREPSQIESVASRACVSSVAGRPCCGAALRCDYRPQPLDSALSQVADHGGHPPSQDPEKA